MSRAFKHDGHLDRGTPVAAGLEEAPIVAQRFDVDLTAWELVLHPLEKISSDAKALGARAHDKLAQHRGESTAAEGRGTPLQLPIGRTRSDDQLRGVVLAQERCFISVTATHRPEQIRKLFTGDTWSAELEYVMWVRL